MIVQIPKFKPLYTTDKRYILLTGGRGSAKSFHASTFATLNSYEAHHQTLYSRYTMSSASISIIPEFKEKIEMLEVDGDFLINRTEIQNVTNGNNIYFRGLKQGSGNQTANLKSLNGLSTWVLDEAEELNDESMFDRVDLSIRNNLVNNKIISILNPTTRDHFFYQKFFKDHTKVVKIDGFEVEMSTHPDVHHIHTTYLDNKSNLPQSFLDVAEKTKRENPKKYHDLFIGAWMNRIDEPLFEVINKYDKINGNDPDAIIGFIDTADTGDDYLCLTIGYVYGTDVFIEDVYHSQEKMEITMSECATMLNKHKVNYCRVESNNGGRLFGVELQKLCPLTAIMFAHETRNKHTRIMMNEPFVTRYVKFNEKLPKLYFSELLNYSRLASQNKKNHDDAIDSLTGLCTFIKGIFKENY